MRILGPSALTFCFIALQSVPMLASMSEWQDLGGGRARLVIAFDPVSKSVEGVIDVELKPGWVTYWRQPGQAGIPPVFDFSSSSGVIVDSPDFPVPTIKRDSGMVSIVYEDNVAFPFKARPLTSPLSGKLSLKLLLGVCREICIPVSASLSQDLSLPNQNNPQSIRIIERARKKLPVIQTGTGEWQEWPEILNVERQSNSIALVRTRVPVSAKKIELLAEGGRKRFFDPAKLLNRKGELALFSLNLNALPKSYRMSAFPLRLTLTMDGKGSEKTIIVDKTQ